MAPRNRKTWKQAESKTASPPPQIPAVDRTEGPSHPAYEKDPDQDKYEKGDTSAWAEDPHKPMSPESPPPAMPGNKTTEELTHPATSDFQETPESPDQAAAAGGGGGKSAAEQPSLKEMAEKRANLCVRIAAQMMPGADAGAVENKALELMDYDDTKLTAAAEVVLAGEDEEVEEIEEELEIEGGKKAAVEITARLDKVEASMNKLVKAMTHFFGGDGDEDGMSDKELMAYLMAEDADGDGVDQNSPDYSYDEKSGGDAPPMEMAEEVVEEDGEEEAMLKAMLEEMDGEMAMAASDKSGSAVEDATEPLATGATIQSGEGGNVNPDAAAVTPEVAQADGSDKSAAEDTGVAENDIEIIAAGDDPMKGLLGDKEASADDELMQLYANLDLPKSAGEEAEEAKEEPVDADAGTDEKAEEDDVGFGADDEGKAGGKKADLELKPQPKAASTGAQTLGNVAGQVKVASDEMDQLSKLWDSAPDVSSVFGVTPTS